MPNCFQLTRLSEKDKGPVSLNQIDRELCQVLGVTEDKTMYVNGWFDYIGFKLSYGKSWAAIWTDLANDEAERDLTGKPDIFKHAVADYYSDMRKCLHYLQDNFTPDNWVEIGRRR